MLHTYAHSPTRRSDSFVLYKRGCDTDACGCKFGSFRSMTLSTNDTLPSSMEGCGQSAQDSTPFQEPVQSKAWPAFAEAWQEATSDNTFTLHGFRRFRTSHLLNLRFLERELADLDHQFFQAGLRTKQPDRPLDKLGLTEAKIDTEIASIDSIVTESSIDKLRDLVKRYGNDLTNGTSQG